MLIDYFQSFIEIINLVNSCISGIFIQEEETKTVVKIQIYNMDGLEGVLLYEQCSEREPRNIPHLFFEVFSEFFIIHK